MSSQPKASRNAGTYTSLLDAIVDLHREPTQVVEHVHNPS